MYIDINQWVLQAFFKVSSRAGKMAQQIKELVAKLDDLSSDPKVAMVKGESGLHKLTFDHHMFAWLAFTNTKLVNSMKNASWKTSQVNLSGEVVGGSGWFTVRKIGWVTERETRLRQMRCCYKIFKTWMDKSKSALVFFFWKCIWTSCIGKTETG